MFEENLVIIDKKKAMNNFDDIMLFQYGIKEESDKAFERLKKSNCLPCPPLGIKCERAMRCGIKDPLASCIFRKKKCKCCVTENV